MNPESKRYYGVTVSIQVDKLPTKVYAVGILRKSQTPEDVFDKSSKVFLYFPLSLLQQDT